MKLSALSQLCQQMLNCQKCALARNRGKVVPGEGAEDARVVFIGEAPGWHEDQQGRPFVGPAGQFLDQLLASVGLKRSAVYICNVVKCRPPENRDPLPGEIEACRQWLDGQLGLIKPKLIVTLGRYSMARYFSGKAISKAHGTWVKRHNVIYYAMYHPAAALHQQSLRRTIEEDMRQVPNLLAQADALAEEEEVEAAKPQQLSMF